MTPTERNLLVRVARRLEEHAMAAYIQVGDAKVDAEARRRRDRELGDARDLRAMAKRDSTTLPLWGASQIDRPEVKAEEQQKNAKMRAALDAMPTAHAPQSALAPTAGAETAKCKE